MGVQGIETTTGELVEVVALLGAAVVAVPLFRRIGLGSVLGYLAAGVLIGPFALGWLTDPESILHVAELGVVMFLFVIGLEMRPSHPWSLRRARRAPSHAGWASGSRSPRSRRCSWSSVLRS